MNQKRRPMRLLAQPRRALRRLLRRPPSDWAGPDYASEAVRRAAPIEPDNRHEIVCFEDEIEELDPELSRLAEAGHRVFRISARGRAEGAAYTLREREPRLFDVVLRGPAIDPKGSSPDPASVGPLFESLDRLRRDAGLGATVSLVRRRDWLGLAERLRAERGWPLLDLAPGEARTPRADAFAAVLAQTFPKISIVIVTHNNRDVNRLCLESLFARTEWPNLEVLVVDNGSSDGTPELLSGLASRHANLRVIALAENRGFPAACNVGLARAAGAHLVLLNNDTVVTRGWLTALHRHLARNPRLGIVGPVTNAIANEAKVDVGYSGLGELAAWAADWVRAHDGETVPISMLAFFCAALRRETYEAVGPLDERFGLGLFEDGDYNRRARDQGWEVLCARDAFVHHWQKASFRGLGRDAYFALYEENRKKYEAKWGEAVGDPSRPGL
jgi:GT2 family glycosyltransferase